MVPAKEIVKRQDNDHGVFLCYLVGGTATCLVLNRYTIVIYTKTLVIELNSAAWILCFL